MVTVVLVAARVGGGMLNLKKCCYFCCSTCRYHDRTECQHDTVSQSETAEQIAEAGGQLEIHHMLGTFLSLKNEII